MGGWYGLTREASNRNAADKGFATGRARTYAHRTKSCPAFAPVLLCPALRFPNRSKILKTRSLQRVLTPRRGVFTFTHDWIKTCPQACHLKSHSPLPSSSPKPGVSTVF